MKPFRTILNEVKLTLGLKPSGEKAEAFMKEFHEDSIEHPFNGRARIYHGASVEASKDGNEIHIGDLLSLYPKSGAGTEALTNLTKLADKHGVKLNLFAKAYSNRPEHITSTPRLIKWYRKHGFQHEEPDYDPSYGSDMKYYPK